MNITLFGLSMLVTLLVSFAVMEFLRPSMTRIVGSLCEAEGGAELWSRSTYVAAVCGNLLLVGLLGEFGANADLLETLRRDFLLLLTGVFLTTTLMAVYIQSLAAEALEQRDRREARLAVQHRSAGTR